MWKLEPSKSKTPTSQESFVCGEGAKGVGMVIHFSYNGGAPINYFTGYILALEARVMDCKRPI